MRARCVSSSQPARFGVADAKKWVVLDASASYASFFGDLARSESHIRRIWKPNTSAFANKCRIGSFCVHAAFLGVPDGALLSPFWLEPSRCGQRASHLQGGRGKTGSGDALERRGMRLVAAQRWEVRGWRRVRVFGRPSKRKASLFAHRGSSRASHSMRTVCDVAP